MQVQRQVVVVIAQIDHRRRQFRQLAQEGPVYGPARPHRDDIAVLEDVPVDRDQVRDV
ncbi:hypothetical protein D3C81_1943320 [compost metagenome]